MKYFAISAVLLVSALSAQVSRADDKFEPFGYVTVGGSRAGSIFDETIGDAFNPLRGQTGDSWGANAHAGYRFHKYLAAEVEYEWMKDFQMRAAGVDIGKVQTQVATANLKVVAPFGEFEPYFLAGAGMIFTSVDKSFALNYDVANGVFTMRFGTGVDWWLSKNFSLSLGAEVVTNAAKVTGPFGGDSKGIDYLTGQFGFGWKF
jgi:hypothetical protein